jgi:hypothetical protein
MSNAGWWYECMNISFRFWLRSIAIVWYNILHGDLLPPSRCCFGTNHLQGSGFDLANSTPRFGFGATFSVATISLTLCAGLFYASILKAQAETEEDDREYMKGKR